MNHGCEKKCYTSRKEAKKAMKMMNHNYGFKLTNVYYCLLCDHYHITSMSKKRSRKLNKKRR
jgi:hypothetical protein